MTATAHRPLPAAPRRASTRIQTRRVFLLARLLTAATLAIFVVLHLAIGVLIYLTPDDDGIGRVDALLSDLRIWACIFVFWMGVITLARRPLRLDA